MPEHDPAEGVERNRALGAAVVLLDGRTLAAERATRRGRSTDALGAVLITSALMLAVYTIVEDNRPAAPSDSRC
ncbi:hypothetical protein [Bailinhaonella thermotolerans]|uniref:Uncharacterized protein n=1 Tax=Bailinhaonella thermotolerans TaxID=1070861 RepID=A0A3A4BC60_9ACTN|nr:hypothetical protein [Bailinhaonella thermotolerans]RJL35686.1 hypothetical protein D5H75_02560 [Bailinhaonella thermotolerans]